MKIIGTAPGLAMNNLLQRRDLLMRYGFALLCAALSLLIRGALRVPTGTTIYQLPLAAVVVSGWYGGRGPGLFALLISATGILYWFIPPVNSFDLPADYTLGLGLFIVLGWLLTEFSGARRRAQRALQQSEMEIVALNERLMKAQEEERSRLAGDLHDGIVQQMTTVNLLLGAAKRQVPPDSRPKATIDEAQEMLIAMGSDLRHLSHELHPALLQEAGLPKALSSYSEEFSKTRGIPVSCEADCDLEELSPGAALAIYRVAQEALANTAKHSKARHVRVRLTRAHEVVRLIVSDDGVGFVLGRRGDSRGIGIINMRERLRHLNGTLAIESEPGRGTTIRAEVPFRGHQFA
jgi:signal transduction histidine kinase